MGIVYLGRDERVDHDRRNLVVRNERAAVLAERADQVVVAIEDLRRLLEVVVLELLRIRQVRIAAVHPQHERDRGDPEHDAHERQDAAPLEQAQPQRPALRGHRLLQLVGLGFGFHVGLAGPRVNVS